MSDSVDPRIINGGTHYSRRHYIYSEPPVADAPPVEPDAVKWPDKPVKIKAHHPLLGGIDMEVTGEDAALIRGGQVRGISIMEEGKGWVQGTVIRGQDIDWVPREPIKPAPFMALTQEFGPSPEPYTWADPRPIAADMAPLWDGLIDRAVRESRAAADYQAALRVMCALMDRLGLTQITLTQEELERVDTGLEIVRDEAANLVTITRVRP